MSWEISFSKEAINVYDSFKTDIQIKIKEKLNILPQWLNNNIPVNIDIKKLKGEWDGFYRIRIGTIRVLVTFDKANREILVHNIAYRGSIY